MTTPVCSTLVVVIFIQQTQSSRSGVGVGNSTFRRVYVPGGKVVGSIDPFSKFVRSTVVSVLPAAASKKYYVVYQPHYWPILFVGAAF